MSSTVVHPAASYNKTCKHVLRTGKRAGELCGKSCTFDAYCQRVEYCASHYAWNLINPDPLPPLPLRKRNSHPPYKQMIFRALEDCGYDKTSVIAIRKYIHGRLQAFIRFRWMIRWKTVVYVCARQLVIKF